MVIHTHDTILYYIYMQIIIDQDQRRQLDIISGGAPDRCMGIS